MKSILVAFFFLIVNHSAIASMSSFKSDFALLPPGTNISLIAQETNNDKKKLFSHQSKQLRIPASTQKIITALAALLELGNDFRFTTHFVTQGKIQAGKLRGNLILAMTGDPTFTRQNLQKMIADLKKIGIKKIEGSVIINTSAFASHNKAAGWSWNNLTQCYHTAPSASIIDGNCFYASLSPSKKIGGTAVALTNSYFPIHVKSQVLTTSAQSNNQYCELDVIAKDKNNYLLTGCIKINNPKKYLHFAVTDGDQYIADIIKTQLARKNISYKGHIIFSKQPIDKTRVVLTSNQSEPLSVLLTKMLKNSNNLIADTVFRTIGAHYFNMPGTWRNSSDAVRKILKDKANIDLKNSVIVDGSGLSRLNLLSAETMLQILKYIANNDKDLKMINMFPIAGIDGTLQYRSSLRHLPFRANIIAKTGYLEGSYNLAGFIKTKSNSYVAFVQFLTGYTEKNETDSMKTEAIMLFENAFYAKYFSHFDKVH